MKVNTVPFRMQLFAFLLTVPIFSSFSQQEFTFSADLVWKKSFEQVSRALDYKNIEGSPYLIDNLIEGTIRFTKGKETRSYLRYNAYTDEMEYLEGNKLLVITNPNEIAAIYLGNYEFNFLYYTLKPTEAKTGYLIKVVDGDCKLYKKINIDFRKAKSATSSYDPPKAPTFVSIEDTWFLSFKNHPPFQITLDKDVIERVFEKHKAVMEYAKDQKLKPKNPDDFAAVVRYYNSQIH